MCDTMLRYPTTSHRTSEARAPCFLHLPVSSDCTKYKRVAHRAAEASGWRIGHWAMILYDLSCDKGHIFEAWFRDSETFARHAKARKVTCAVCGSAKVRKAPMAPNVSRSRSDEKAAGLRTSLKELREKIESNCDYVGPAFAEEARKIHYGESEPRGIYGETSDDEARNLKEEGVPFARVPWLPKDNA